MKKFLLSMTAALLLLTSTAVYAETTETSAGECEFTGNKMVSSFDSTTVAVSVSEMEPGDSATFSVNIKNTSEVTTSWYMSNDVLQSLEDAQEVAENGGYTYILTYTDSNGNVTDIYNSSSVGGTKTTVEEVGEGLNEATDSLDSFFYLTDLAPNESGRVDLFIELDGESQGNIYQDTLAKLMMNFAVETPNGGTYNTPPRVKTGDVFQIGAVICLVAGILLFLFAFIKNRKDRDDEKKKKNTKKAKTVGALALAILVGLSSMFGTTTVKANTNYTYTVTISAGNRGAFEKFSALQIQKGCGNSATISVDKNSDKITITGLEYGDVVSFNAQSGVTLEENSRYYVQGIRLSGRDNNTVAQSAFTVKEDQDYVVAYGIPGDLTEYTVNYVDGAGNKLAESQTYYGNVGDEPVIAYLYIDGYMPSSYNVRHKLVNDPTQNVFDFVYTAINAGNNGGDNGDNGDNGGNGNGGNANGGGNANNNGDNGNANGDDNEPVIIDNNQVPLDDTDETNDSTDVDDGNGGNTNIDEVDPPKGSNVFDYLNARGLLIPIISGLAAAIALIVILVFLLSKNKKKKAAVVTDNANKEEKKE